MNPPREGQDVLMKIGIYIPYKTSLVSTLLHRERERSAPGLTEMEMIP